MFIKIFGKVIYFEVMDKLYYDRYISKLPMQKKYKFVRGFEILSYQYKDLLHKVYELKDDGR